MKNMICENKTTKYLIVALRHLFASVSFLLFFIFVVAVAAAAAVVRIFGLRQ